MFWSNSVARELISVKIFRVLFPCEKIRQCTEHEKYHMRPNDMASSGLWDTIGGALMFSKQSVSLFIQS